MLSRVECSAEQSAVLERGRDCFAAPRVLQACSEEHIETGHNCFAAPRALQACSEEHLETGHEILALRGYVSTNMVYAHLELMPHLNRVHSPSKQSRRHIQQACPFSRVFVVLCILC